jgi:hypothetical protein
MSQPNTEGMKRLGTGTEARDKLGLPDAAAVWDMVSAKQLVVTRESDDVPWTFWLPVHKEGK